MRRRRPASEPTHEQLAGALREATRLRVSEVVGGSLLLEVGDPDAVASIASLVRILPGEPFHCMCPGDQTLEFLGPGTRRTSITLHHGRSIRWDGVWDTDVLLDHPGPLLDWLADRGVSGPRDEADRLAVQEWNASRLWEVWKKASPPSLRQLLDGISVLGGVPPDIDEPVHLRAADAIRVAYSDREQAILALLGWFGSGEGPWSGFPSYETIAEWLLLRYPTTEIVSALAREDLSPSQLEGAGRLVASFWFARLRPGDAARIPAEVVDRLLSHVERSANPDNRARLRAALGG